MSSVTGIGLDSKWNSSSQADSAFSRYASKLSNIPISSLYPKSEKIFKIQFVENLNIFARCMIRVLNNKKVKI
jgi:hypothetical protein